MTKVLIYNTTRFVLLLFLQVALLKNIGYYNIVTPFPYILFILLLPINTSNLLLYVIAFLTGLTVDAFYNTIGVHAAACVALAFFRIFFFTITLEVDQRESFQTPSWGNMNFKWYGPYILIATFIQHLVLFFLEVFSFKNILDTLYSIVLSSLLTVVIIYVISLLTYTKKNKLMPNS